MTSYTFVMIKPDVVEQNKIGSVINMIENDLFRITSMTMLYLSEEQAREFYDEHRFKSHFDDLIEFITSGPVIPMVLESSDDDDAVEHARSLIGATNPEEQKFGTIRHAFATDIGRNAIHGSDSNESAIREIELFRSWT